VIAWPLGARSTSRLEPAWLSTRWHAPAAGEALPSQRGRIYATHVDAADIANGIRSSSGQSRKSLAKAAGTSTTTVSRVETGESDATWGMLTRLAEAAGLRLDVSMIPMPTLAAAADATPEAEQEPWLHLRLAVQAATRDRANAGAVIAPEPATDNQWTLNLLAGVAESIAASNGLSAPAWTHTVPPLTTPWRPHGTPSMIRRSEANAPRELSRRGIFLDRASIWESA